MASSRPPLTLNAKSPRTELAEPCGAGDGAGREERELEEVAAVERQPADLPLVDERGERRRVAVDWDERRGDVDVLPDGDGERHVEPEILADGELRLPRVDAEAGQRHVEAVLADLELGQREAAVVVGRPPCATRRCRRGRPAPWRAGEARPPDP